MSSLPTNPKQPWPPAGVPVDDFNLWDEWYSGRFARPGTILSSERVTTGSFPERWTGGFVHRHANLRISNETGSRPGTQVLHVPLAADIAQKSAALLFGEMPSFAVDDAATQERLALLTGDLQNELLVAAETGAALGGSYLRIVWDRAVADVPFVDHVDADRAVPDFRHGKLVAVTFWHEVTGDDGKGIVLRHLERYEPGWILHGLYRGDRRTLGYEIPLAGSPETEGLEAEIALPAALLAAVYAPNMLPMQHRRWSPLGRPDIAGAEGDLDALDETWSGLMRDVRHAQSRILIPMGALSVNDPSNPRGSGRSFELDREVFTDIDVPPEGMQPTFVQPEIRTAAYIDTATELIRQIVSKGGYSPRTFGLDMGTSGHAESGTALRIREQDTYRTLARQRRYWEPALAGVLEALLAIDAAEFASGDTPECPDVVWQEEDTGAGEMAQTVQMLFAAQAASIERRVRLVNPTWTDDDVNAEVARISAETGALVPPPAF